MPSEASSQTPVQDFVDRTYERLESAQSRRREPLTPWTRTSSWGRQRLKEHLRETYGVPIKRVTDLNGAFRVDRADGSRWVARVFPQARSLEAVEGDAEILRYLERHGFPAERNAHPQPVSVVDGRPVLVTHFVAGRPPAHTGPVLQEMGRLLGRLHTLPPEKGPVSRPGGAYHLINLDGGTRRDDANVMKGLLDAAAAGAPAAQRPLYRRLQDELDNVDFCEDLPHALVHIDYGGPNLLATSGTLVGIDWAGAGRGPRVFSLSSLKYATSGNRALIDAFVAGYREHVQLEPEELARLGPALNLHSLILACWVAVFAPSRVASIVSGLDADASLAERAATHAREAFAADPSALVGWETVEASVDQSAQLQILIDAVVGKPDAAVDSFAELVGGYPRLCDMILAGFARAYRPRDCDLVFVLGDDIIRSVKGSKSKLKVSKQVPASPAATVHATAVDFVRVAARELRWTDLLAQGKVTVDGDAKQLAYMYGLT